MKRRRFVKGLAVAPAVSTLVAQQPAAPPPQTPNPANPARPVEPPTRAAETPKLEFANPDAAAETVTRFFNPQQFAALHKLSDVIMPSMNNFPGAIEAQVPEFLDFYVGKSLAEKQKIYTAGLDALNAQSQKQFKKPFAEVDSTQADALLAPLRKPWTYDPPDDPLARFLQSAKLDIRTATMNSREYSTKVASSGRRGFGGGNLYWYPIP